MFSSKMPSGHALLFYKWRSRLPVDNKSPRRGDFGPRVVGITEKEHEKSFVWIVVQYRVGGGRGGRCDAACCLDKLVCKCCLLSVTLSGHTTPRAVSIVLIVLIVFIELLTPDIVTENSYWDSSTVPPVELVSNTR